jgi:hypothetical protein
MSFRHLLLAGAVGLALWLPAAAGAQTVWRCGPDGTRFQDTPCTEGRTLALKAAPGRDAVQEAHDVAERERLALQALGEERRQRERDAVARGLGPAGIKPLPPPPRPPRPQDRLRTPGKPSPWASPPVPVRRPPAG